MKSIIKPAYGRGSVVELMPALLGHDRGDSLPVTMGAKRRRVLFVLDGLGWCQFERYRSLLPNLSRFAGGPITTVSPSTTAVALTSIATSLPPSQHGLIGYRIALDGMVLNSLRWATDDGVDARQTHPPDLIQPYDPFIGHSVAMVTKAEFEYSGFTKASLRGGRLSGYRTVSVLLHEAIRLIRDGEDLVYAYYDGIDKVAHEFGLGSEYERELAFADMLVGQLMDSLPSGSEVVVTADHGQVDCRGGLQSLDAEVTDHCLLLSGEPRFRWLHAKPGREADLLVGAKEFYGHSSWIFSAEEVVEQNILGPAISSEARSRLGDVALVPFENIGFEDPAEGGPFELVGRHGSLTDEEMYVPCLSAVV